MKILFDALPNTISNIKFAMLYFDNFDIVVPDVQGKIPFANIEHIADIVRDGRVKLETLSNDIDLYADKHVCNRFWSIVHDEINKKSILGRQIMSDMYTTSASYHCSKIYSKCYPYLDDEGLHDYLIALGQGRNDDYDVFVMWQLLGNSCLLSTALAYIDCGYDIMVGSNAINYAIKCIMQESNNLYEIDREMLNILLPSFDKLNFDEISLLKEKCSDELIELKYYLNNFIEENDKLSAEDKKIRLQKSIKQFERKVKDRQHEIFHSIFRSVGNFTYVPLLATCFPDIPKKIALALSAGYILENILHEVRKCCPNQLKDDPLYFTHALNKKYSKRE